MTIISVCVHSGHCHYNEQCMYMVGRLLGNGQCVHMVDPVLPMNNVCRFWCIFQKLSFRSLKPPSLPYFIAHFYVPLYQKVKK